MKTTTFIQNQLSHINTLFQDIVGDITDREWITRPAQGHNLAGYTAWHIPRIQDSFVQLWIRGIPELAHGEQWQQWQHLKQSGVGVGITLEQADEIAHTVHRADVLTYAADVHQEITGWLKNLDENDLDQIPDVAQHLAVYPEYLTPGFHKETDSLYHKPIWNLFLRPCIGHVHRHLGELEVIKSVLRTRQP
jgi:AraC-like DNA-binding protein